MSSLNNSSSTLMVVEFSKSTQNVCMCIGISALLIIIFMMTPLNSFMLSSIFGKVIILTLLGYTLYYNIVQTNKFSKSINTNDWAKVSTNIYCSYLFSFFIFILILSVIRKIF
jgi:hypothetical protein